MKALSIPLFLSRLWLILFLPLCLIGTLIPMDFQLFWTLKNSGRCLPFGCDAFGRNLITLTLHSAGNSLLIGFSSVIILSLLSFGALYIGIFAAQRFRNYWTGAIEFLQIFPGLILSLTLAALFGPGWLTLCLSLVLNGLPGNYRFLILMTEPILRKTYIEASKSMGASSWFLFRRHLLPEAIDSWRWKLPNLVAQSLLLEATLSFLGIGAVIGSNTWGTQLAQGKDYLLEAPQIALTSGLPLLLTVLSLLIISEPKLWKPVRRTQHRILAPPKKMPLRI